MTCDSAFYIINGDTLISGKKMKKVYKSHINNYFAAIHEDTLNAKYYVVYKGSSEEKLFMDFSVEKDDVVKVSDNKASVDVVVEKTYFGETGRKSIYVKSTNSGDFDFWVEGVGSTLDILIPDVSLYGHAGIESEALVRVTMGDSIVYERVTVEDCEYLKFLLRSSINNANHDTGISIYPNPAKDFLLIDIESFDCLNYEIISTSGTVLQSGDLLPSIDIGKLPQGVKMMVIRDENGQILATKRFVKNN